MTQDLLSLGKVAELTQEAPGRLQRALDRLGIEPALILNDVAYYVREASGKALLAVLDGDPPMIRGQGITDA